MCVCVCVFTCVPVCLCVCMLACVHVCASLCVSLSLSLCVMSFDLFWVCGTGLPVESRLAFSWDQAFHVPYSFVHRLSEPGKFDSEVVNFSLREAVSGRVCAQGKVDISQYLDETTKKAEVTVEMERFGMLERLTR